MTAVTQRIDNYLGGVSKQSDDKKRVGQVKECINGYPDPTFGLIKRPGLKWISNLGTGTTYDSSKWFYINRGSGEKYIGCITPAGGGTGTIAMWNATTGAACSITYGTGAQAYLTGARDNYHILNLEDTSIITNNLITAAMQSAPSYTAKKQATLVLSGTSLSTAYTITITPDGGSTSTVTVTTDSDDTYSDTLTKIKTAIDAESISNLTTTKYKTTLHLSKTAAFNITATGGSDGSSIRVFQDEVTTRADLPQESFHNHTVKLINSANLDFDDYWNKFVADDGTSGIGSWQETIDPSVSVGVDSTTVPHELVKSGTNAFTFQKVTWVNRLVGDDTTVPQPSFIGNKIEESFYHNRRLGFLSVNTVFLGKTGSKFNLWYDSAQQISDSDPIDLEASTIRPVTLTSVIPTTQGLVLFSRNQQFLMASENGVLTPTTTNISPISNYEVDSLVDPVDTGTSINFISKTPSYTRVHAMQTRGQDENPDVVDISRIVNEWIPETIDTFISSPQNQFIALSSQSSKKVYFFRIYTVGDKNAMEAWFNWDVCGTVQSIVVDEDDMLFVTKQGSQFTFSKASLSQSPEDAIIVNNDGQKINPCIDLYATASSSQYKSIETITISNGGTGYSTPPTISIAGSSGINTGTPGSGATATCTVSGGAVNSITITNGGSGYTNGATISFSGGGGSNAAATASIYDGTKCYIRYNNDTALTPVLVVKGSATTGQLTESGFTITPSTGTDGLGTYFKVPVKDLVTDSADDIILGFKYDYDITLPKTYYRLDESMTRTDFTANLTIARMKFAVGLSGVMGFKLKSTGIRQGKKTYTGYDTTATNPGDFSWIEEDLAYVDRDQIKLKINNFESTAFTFVDDTTIRLNSTPIYTATANGSTSTFTWTFDRTNSDPIKVLEGGVLKTHGTDYEFTGTKSIVFIDGNNAPRNPAGSTEIKIYCADEIIIYLDEWYNLNPVPTFDTYLANDVALAEQSVFNIPIHQKTDNFQLRIFNDSPFPVSLNSMMWEGNYSPRFYRRT